jgi:hypothetical protein
VLQGHAVQVKECQGNIPAIGQQDVLRANREEHGGQCGQHVSEEHIAGQTLQRLNRDIPDVEEVRYVTKPLSMCLWSILGKSPWLCSV